MRKTLPKSEIRALNDKLREMYGWDLLDKKSLVQNEDDKFLYVDGDLMFFFHEKKWVPSLKQLLGLKTQFLKKVTVNMGAIEFVVGGADIMRPGVVKVDAGVKVGDYVLIEDERNQKPIAVGVALFSTEQINSFLKGRIVKNLHWVGDPIWKMF